MTPFTAIAFGLCASLSPFGAQDILQLGYLANNDCIIHAEIGDTHGESAVILGHDIGVEMIEGGAVIHIDGLMFVIPKTEGV
jgi:hypothetical protein